MVFYTGAAFTSMLMVLLACALIMVTLIAMGILVSLLGLLWRRIGSIVGVIGILFEMLAGAYAPVSEFPAVIRGFAYVLPFTWGYDLIRYYAFDRQWNTLVPVHLEWIIMIGIAVFFTLVSRSLLILVERTAKEQGLHLI
jgi:ABC-2 type transport system permease protein